MSRANERNIVKYQYTSDKNLNDRQALHTKFSTNKYGWYNWVFEQYKFKSHSRVIEFGCGNGAIWSNNKNRIPEDMKLILTDFSEGMLNSTKESLSGIHGDVDFSVMDIQNIPLQDNSFDVAIANHMLYHVPNRDLAVSEIARILKPEGTFYATTNGSNHMKGLKALVKCFDPKIDYAEFSVAKEFGLENGAEQLTKHFETVEMFIYEDSLHITEAKPLVDYVLSLVGHVNIEEIMTESKINDFYKFVGDIILRDGSINIPKSSGIFIGRKPKKV